MEDWLTHNNHIYIGRHNDYVKGAIGSKWKNPFSVRKYGREGCIKEFEKHLYSSGLIDDILELKGKVLGCWCKPEGCHGDVLVKALQKKLGEGKPSQSSNSNTNPNAQTNNRKKRYGYKVNYESKTLNLKDDKEFPPL